MLRVHGPEKRCGRLRLDLRAAALTGGMTGPAIVPGDVDQSLLIRRVLGLDGEDRMPLDKDPLSSEQIERLRDWIAGGAPWPDDSIPQTAPHGTAHIASKPTAPMIALATCLSMAGSDIAGA